MNLCAGRTRNLWVAVLLFILCFFLFAPTLSHPFMMDDKNLIVRNQALFDPGFLQIDYFSSSKSHISGSTYVYFRPVTQILNALPAYLFYKDAFIYRLFSLLFFYIACFSVYQLTLSLFKSFSFAVLTAALFCMHPVNGILVNYITAAGFSVLITSVNLGIVLFLKGRDQNKKIYLVISTFFFLIALLCHEIAIAFPLYLGAVLYFVRREKLIKTIKLCLPFAAFVILYYFFRQHYASYQVSLGERLAFLGLTAAEFTASFAQCIFWYAKALFALSGIVLMWTPQNPSEGVLFWNICLSVSVGAALYLMFVRWRDEYAFGLSWIFIGLMPTVLACISRPSFGMIIEPHWLFFSTIGFCLIVSKVLLSIYRQTHKALGIALIILLLLAYGRSTWRYNELWGNEKTYCHYMSETSPRVLTHFWLADAYMEEGDLIQARKHYTKTLNGTGNDGDAYTNLGFIEDTLGNKEKAKEFYFKAIKLIPGSSEPKNNLAAIYIENKQFEKAEKLLLEIVRTDYYYIDARKNLILVYSEKGMKAQAAGMLEEIIKINPQDPDIASLQARVDQMAVTMRGDV